MKSHFVVLGLLTVVFIQVELGTAQEHLDAIAQVIAESDGNAIVLISFCHGGLQRR
jgi:hypothetical protein